MQIYVTQPMRELIFHKTNKCQNTLVAVIRDLCAHQTDRVINSLRSGHFYKKYTKGASAKNKERGGGGKREVRRAKETPASIRTPPKVPHNLIPRLPLH